MVRGGRNASKKKSHSNSGPRILFTGVGGSIGTAISERLESAGFQLVRLSQAGKANEGIVVQFSDDVALSKAIRDVPGRLDGIVAAHGILRPGPLSRVTPDEWRSVLDVNLNSIYVILHSGIPKLRSGASIVVISSTAAFDHSPVGGPHYTASKWALNGLVRHLADELGPKRIRINAVCPGLVDNPMGRAYLSKSELRTAAQEIPLKRGARPDEIAAVVNFLLGSGASYMTGALVPVSGGYR
jgi:NAD(P)-dependent dehydrogenase (short-subunit alcohol dehydrogenase family)